MNKNNLRNVSSKIRKSRRVLNLSQAELSKKLDISPSYLNLIESGKRPITVPLLIKLGNILGISLKDLTPEENQHLLSDVMDTLSNEMFNDVDITNIEVSDFVSNNPNLARALLILSDNHRNLSEDIQNRLEKIDVDSISKKNNSTRLPAEIVSDFLQGHSNYFMELENIAIKIRETKNIKFDHYLIGGIERKLRDLLIQDYQIKIKIESQGVDNNFVRSFNKKTKTLILSDMLGYTGRKFQYAYQIASLEGEEMIEEIIGKNKIYSEGVKNLLKISLFNYLAASIIMPYEEFINTARQYRYDVEILMHHFATSFEQVTHRLTTLQAPKNEGVPFHMLKVDVAGNVSKRFSLSGIHIPRHGGACPRWNVYTAFLNPGRIQTQISRMPEGKVYFCIARAYEKGVEKHGMPKSFVSIGLGCDIKYASELTYAEGMDLNNKNLETPIGVSCRICPRMNCQQRAFPPIDRELNLNVNYKGISPYISE